MPNIPRLPTAALAAPLAPPAALAALAALAAFAAAPLALHAQRSLTDIPEPDTAAELADFVVADGFEVTLFAADPLIRKPIQISFDADGRLWVASSAIYPQIEPGQAESDQIVVLEDTDGDGTADKSTVFADGFLIPTGVLHGDGGTYMADSTDMLFLKDTDGDGRADSEEVVLSGFGTEDTHHIIHSFAWGPAGEMFFNQSIYIHSHVETPWGVERLDGGGIWRFQRGALKLEVFSRGMVNSWGHIFDPWGQSFATDGAYHEGINYVFPGAQFFTAVGATRMLEGLSKGEPKHSGLARVSGRHFPESWQGNLLTNDFRANRVNRFTISEAGSGYATEKMDDLLRSRRVSFRPVDIKMGPDGAIYIADWYNPIIQHGEVDFRDERRDKSHGRIWKVTAKDRPLVEIPDIGGASVDELLAMLTAAEQWTSDQARLRLQRMDPADDLVSKVKALGAHADPNAQLQALWILQGLGVTDRALLGALLGSPDHRARAAAVRTLYYGYVPPAEMLAELAAAARDPHPRVRLEAVRALGQIPTLEAAAAAMAALDGEAPDRFLDYALWLTARELAPAWLPAVRDGHFDFNGNAAHLIFALQAVNSPDVAAPLARVATDPEAPSEDRARAADILANVGGQPELDLLYQLARDGDTPDGLRPQILEALDKAATERKVKPSGDLAGIRDLITAGTLPARQAAIGLAGAWGVAEVADDLVALAVDPDAAGDLRRAAIDGLAGTGGDASKEALESVATGGDGTGDRLAALAALAQIDLGRAARAGVQVLQDAAAPEMAASVFPIFVSRGQGPAALAKELAGQQLAPPVAEAGIRALASSGQQSPDLESALRASGTLAATPMAPTPAELEALVTEVRESGDPVRGESVYRRPQLLCIQCHAIGGAGGRVGSDLVGIGASAPIDYLIESLLDPNAKVKEGYHLTTVTTKDGGVFAGTSARETDTHLVLIDAANQDQEIPLDQIASQEIGKSLMPAGLTASLSRAEFVDLVRFLHDLGRTQDLSIAGGDQAVRSWSVKSDQAGARLPVTARVSGDLTAADLAAAAGPQGSYELHFTVEVAAPGDLTLQFDHLDGLNRLDFAGTTLTPAHEITVGLPAGRHHGMVRLIPSQRQSPLKLTLKAADATQGAAAGVRVVTPE